MLLNLSLFSILCLPIDKYQVSKHENVNVTAMKMIKKVVWMELKKYMTHIKSIYIVFILFWK